MMSIMDLALIYLLHNHIMMSRIYLVLVMLVSITLLMSHSDNPPMGRQEHREMVFEDIAIPLAQVPRMARSRLPECPLPYSHQRCMSST